MKRLIILSAVILAAASAASAQVGGAIGLFSDAEGSDCTVGGPVVELHVIHYGHGGATASEFVLEFPFSWSHLDDVWDYPAIGNSVEGVSLNYGGCVTAPTHLGVVRFLDVMGQPCEEIRVSPAYGKARIEALDCAAALMFPAGDRILTDCGPCGVTPPYNLQPTDGTAGVSLNPTLSWSWEEPTGCVEGLGITAFTVYMGTDPGNLPMAGWTDGAREITVGPLQPGTTYYWQVTVWEDFYTCPGDRTAESPVQSFTTAGPVPVEQTTWGRIKGLYR